MSSTSSARPIKNLGSLLRTVIQPIVGRKPLGSYFFAMAAVFLAFVVRLAADPWLGNSDPYLTFLLAVAVTGLYTRVGPSLFAVLLGAAVAYFCFVPPRYRWGFAGASDAVGFAIYLFAALAVVLLTRARTRAVEKLKLSISDLQESEARFRTLADNVSQMVWMADDKRQISWYNQRWVEYTGTTLEEAGGWGWQKLHHPDHLQRVVESSQHCWERGEPWEDTFPLRGKDGEYRWFLSRAVPIRDDNGKVIRWFGTNTDVTERMKAEQALRRSEKIAAAGKLAASVAHELNNPLAIAVNLAFLAKSERNDFTRSQYLEGIERELRRATSLANRTLSFYHGASKTQVNIQKLADEVIRIFEPHCIQQHIRIVPQIVGDAAVNGSREELHQVLVNLLSNAIDAIGQHGAIYVRAAVRKKSALPNALVQLTIADTGCGIEAQNLSKIFEPFFTTKGIVASGLGMWITKNVVLRHGGTIRVRSRSGAKHHGTVVSIRLPVSGELPPLVLKKEQRPELRTDQGSEPTSFVRAICS